MLQLDGSEDLRPFLLDVRVVDRPVLQAAEHFIGFGDAALVVQQAGGLGKEMNHADGRDAEDGLERNGEAPDYLSRRMQHTVVEPVSDQNATTHDGELECDEGAAPVCFARLRDPCGNGPVNRNVGKFGAEREKGKKKER